MDTEITKLTARLEGQREAALSLLNDITDDQLDFVWERAPGEEGPFTIRRLLQRVITHHEDHIQHIRKSRQMIGKRQTETQRLLARLQVLRAELLASLIGLDDEDLNRDLTNGRQLGALTPPLNTPEAASARGASMASELPDAMWASEVEVLYTIKRIVQHIVEMETMRWKHVREAMDKASVE